MYTNRGLVAFSISVCSRPSTLGCAEVLESPETPELDSSAALTAEDAPSDKTTVLPKTNMRLTRFHEKHLEHVVCPDAKIATGSINCQYLGSNRPVLR